MSGTELKILEIVWDWGGEASVNIITREANISIDYARLICESLARESCIDFSRSKLCNIKDKGKLIAARKKDRNLHLVRSQKFFNGARKIVLPERLSRFGLGKDKKGKLILNY